jgi:hypothetical protein
MCEVFRRVGTNLSAGFGLQMMFKDAGVEPVDMWLYAPVGGAADWAGYELHTQGFRSGAPLLERFGIATARDLDLENFTTDMHAEVEATGRPAMIAPHVCAWGRKPV